jgi:hypothetical protein
MEKNKKAEEPNDEGLFFFVNMGGTFNELKANIHSIEGRFTEIRLSKLSFDCKNVNFHFLRLKFIGIVFT